MQSELGLLVSVEQSAARLLFLAGEPNVELVAVADPDPTRRKRVLDGMKGVRVFDDYRQMFDACDLDAVCIGLPTWMHRPSLPGSSAARITCALRKTAFKQCDRVNTCHPTRREKRAGVYVCPPIAIHVPVDGGTQARAGWRARGRILRGNPMDTHTVVFRTGMAAR